MICTLSRFRCCRILKNLNIVVGTVSNLQLARCVTSTSASVRIYRWTTKSTFSRPLFIRVIICRPRIHGLYSMRFTVSSDIKSASMDSNYKESFIYFHSYMTLYYIIKIQSWLARCIYIYMNNGSMHMHIYTYISISDFSEYIANVATVTWSWCWLVFFFYTVCRKEACV